jgi:Carbohydrate binding domain
MRTCFFFCWLCLSAARLMAQNFTGGFPFMLPEFDGSAQTFLPAFPAYEIGEAHRVRPQGGEFVTGSTPIRFWGVNLVAAAAFPPKADAPGIAARMRKMGINLVRFHHLENTWSGDDGTIFLYRAGTRSLQATTLDRLDFFIAQLKKNGIYVNMNLNVSREFKRADGVIGADSLSDFGKGVTLFDPWIQFLQREYADQLLGHINPYTGMPLAKDPVLAMVEMNNENSLYGYWKEERLRPFAQGGKLMMRHSRLLDSLWGAYLLQKYPNQTALAQAWNVGIVPPGSGELLRNGGFETGTVSAPWTLETFEGAQGTLTAERSGAYEGQYAAKLQVNKVTGTDWHLQLKQNALTLKKDSAYVLRFAVRASGNFRCVLGIMRDDAPYTWYAGTDFQTGTNWQEVTFAFVAKEDINTARILLQPLQNVGTFYFDAFSLAPPSVTGLLPAENLAKGTVQRINWNQRQLFSIPRVSDIADFYTSLQKRHFDQLRIYLRDQTGVQSAITGTNALGGPADASLHEDLDYMDDHSYWDHPQFTRGDWDPVNWIIDNKSMLKSASLDAMTSALSGLSLMDKPFTISEYNHGSPNRFRTEMPLAMAAYASFQGVDGIMFFEYNGEPWWGRDVTNNFFSLTRENPVMALFPACALAYRQGYIAPAADPLVVNYTTGGLHQMAKTDPEGRWGRFTPYDKRLLLTRGVQTGSYRAGTMTNFSALPTTSGSPFTTSTGETRLHTDRGLLTTGTPRYCAIGGFLDEAPGTTAGDLQLQRGSGYGAITWVSTVGTPLRRARRSLLTIAARQQNTGMVWASGNRTVNANWGRSPTLQQPLQLTLRLQVDAESLRLYPLDTLGREETYRTLLPVSPGIFEILIDQNVDRTLWFGLEAFGAGISGVIETPDALRMSIAPNPVTGHQVSLRWENLQQVGDLALSLTDLHGRVLRQAVLPAPANGWDIPVGDLPGGIYIVVARTTNGQLLGRKRLVK